MTTVKVSTDGEVVDLETEDFLVAVAVEAVPDLVKDLLTKVLRREAYVLEFALRGYRETVEECLRDRALDRDERASFEKDLEITNAWLKGTE